jgi:hypothetical protein
VSVIYVAPSEPHDNNDGTGLFHGLNVAAREEPSVPSKIAKIPYNWPFSEALYLDSTVWPDIRPSPGVGISRAVCFCLTGRTVPIQEQPRAAQRFRDDRMMIAVNP